MPDYLESTIGLLDRSFPNGLGADDYVAVLKILQPHMSQRNLSEVIAIFVSRDQGLVYNDVLGVDGRSIEASIIERVQRVMNEAGFDQWLRET